MFPFHNHKSANEESLRNLKNDRKFVIGYLTTITVLLCVVILFVSQSNKHADGQIMVVNDIYEEYTLPETMEVRTIDDCIIFAFSEPLQTSSFKVEEYYIAIANECQSGIDGINLVMNTDRNNGWIKYDRIFGFRGSADNNELSNEIFNAKEGNVFNEIIIQIESIEPDEYVEIYVPMISRMENLYNGKNEMSVIRGATFVLSVFGKDHILDFKDNPKMQVIHEFNTGRHTFSRRNILSDSSSSNPNADSNLNLSIMAFIVCIVFTLCCCVVFVMTSFGKNTDKGEIKSV
jgi:hypothetical protein